jgi:hypothetical protein
LTTRLNAAGEHGSRRAVSTAIRCARRTATSSRRAAYAGFRSCCCQRSPGPGAAGHSRSSLSWPPRNGIGKNTSQAKRQHKKLTDWGRQVLIQAALWLPHRRIIGIGDASFAAIDLLNDVRPWITMITRLRLDAALHKPAPRRVSGKVGRPPVVGKRQPTLKQRLVNPKTGWRRLLVKGWYGRGERVVEIVSGTAVWNHPGHRVPIRYVLVRDPAGKLEPQAFLCTDLEADPLDILRWFIRRWSIEVTFAEVRRHLGVETQRQWSEPAIARTTPILLGLFSLITLWANEAYAARTPVIRIAGWYRKSLPTFSDALACIRRELWAPGNLSGSRWRLDPTKIPSAQLNTLIDLACYAA